MELLIFIVVILIIFSFVYASFIGAPWVPTKKKDVRRFLNLANIKSEEIMYDLGCGDGRLVFAAADVGARAKGLEISIIPLFFAYIKKIFFKNKSRVKFIYQDLWSADLRDADIIYVWLMPEKHAQLREKLQRELKEGARVISYVWEIKGWEPIQIDKSEDSPSLYLYKKRG